MSVITTTLGGEKITLARPRSYAARYDVLVASGQNQSRALVAALGLCWVGPTRPRARYERTHNPLTYGGEVLDELVERGLRRGDILAAAVQAWPLATEGLADAEAVKEVEGKSEAPEGDSTSR